MSGRETVHEFEVSVTVTLEAPRERGGELQTVATESLSAVSFARSAAVVDVVAVDAREDALAVADDADLTLHFDAVSDANRARNLLADGVTTIEDFEVLTGPYEIGAW